MDVLIPQQFIGFAQAQVGAHAGQQNRRGHRLADVVHRTDFESVRDVVFIAVTGEKHHRNRRRLFMLFELLAKGVTAQVGQADIEQNQVRHRL
ncbi:hypothetical protein GALL_421620 [mine drainage metagenome]|uniref:Uncharacterized protein n=1 Tax=mine drainage metagenome TaxID=410659 RepID=A0A1J5PXE8_9ZZZZ